MNEQYTGMAIGIFELDSECACFVALDAASKAANVRIQAVERNRLKSGACVKDARFRLGCPRCHGRRSAGRRAHSPYHFSHHYRCSGRRDRIRHSDDHWEITGRIQT